MNRRAITLAIATGLVAASALAAPASAYVPIDIGFDEPAQAIESCLLQRSGSPYPVAWKLYPSGGPGSGAYAVSVSFGDGRTAAYSSVTYGKTVGHWFACGLGLVTQNWTVSRGGSSAREATTVYTY